MIRWVLSIYKTAQTDLKEFLRYRMAVISTILTSFIMVLSFALGTRGNIFSIEGMPYFTFVLPGILALGTMQSAIYSAGYTIILDRQRRLIDDIVLSPVAYSAFVTGRVVSALLKSAVQFSICILLIVVWLHIPVEHPGVLFFSFLTTAVLLCSIGIIVGACSNILSVASIANLITLPLTYFCGVFFPVRYLQGIGSLARWIPFTASVEGFRYGLTGETLVGDVVSNMWFVAVSAVLNLAICVLVFKRAVLARG